MAEIVAVVDDNESKRYVLARLLRREGYEVREAATGSEAVQIASTQPDAIILDVRLPDANGYEVCRTIKSAAETSQIQVLLITSHTTTGADRAVGLESGADGYLVHPVDPAELLATVRALLRIRRAERQQAELLRKAESALAEAEAERERMRALLDEQTRMRRQLEQAAELREQILGIVGHDLRNPLASITMAAATLLKRGGLNPADVRTAQRISASASRMARIIDQVLDFTRSRIGGGIQVRRAPMDLGELCREACDELEAAAQGRPIQLTVEGDASGEWDRERLAQVVSNLVGNAIAHGAPGTPIAVAVRGMDGEVVLSVRNDGAPIPPELVPVIFEPFRSGKATKPGNLGLGLYIVSQIARAHGGSVDVRSAAGEGTTLTVRLPRT